ncbi:hypothetical protein Fleli_3647 [Bernardetia litoralis DSM 6794]|uniref:Uncharacterized protein n=1 Tax=Bernardetia litoralis (strain ATCC 23117 / DSM 6794 / NBRC 15988 / NCIMB 1366 / Fx l1 / Sio-4) TaxID=880071 RepID=I4APS7_BERLS|nr:hypothetical protein [Bernardetia litoralis]AFM05962.1 hypothetical protein Fleli_3647 [Bernardetia litoralis DSM 6794]
MKKYSTKEWLFWKVDKGLENNHLNKAISRLKNSLQFNILIMVAIAFYLCMSIGIAKQEIAKRLPKIFRRDRIHKLSTFQIGKGIIEYYQDRNLKLNKLLKKSLFLQKNIFYQF